MAKLSTEAYKGVRDFYPEDEAVQKYIFNTWRSVVEKYGYQEYNASILEPAELYSAKTNEEHVNEQTYTFTDRGDRQVTLRPEMTPTVARMVAARRRELSFPLRWYSIPNVFRYERPQRGRLREHWQLNADIFGVSDVMAEAEVITLSYRILEAFGATAKDFQIRIGAREMYHTLLTDHLSLSDEERRDVLRTIDKKAKISDADFTKELETVLGKDTSFVREILSIGTISDLEEKLKQRNIEAPWTANIRILIETLARIGITNVLFDPSLVRGFDYYTGTIFEVFDTHPENTRSLFGGGRYDKLLEMFGGESIPAVGFGMGDVTMRDFLAVRNLLPKISHPARVYICPVDASHRDDAIIFAETLRHEGVAVAVHLTNKKIGDQIKIAEKQGIPYLICIGVEEITGGRFIVKHLPTSTETTLPENAVAAFVLKDL
ncbi:MAG: histidine--tRNA ligase [Patescibacteria group bacterium]